MRKKISFILILLLAPVLMFSSSAIAGPDDIADLHGH